jgi:hypothetical protein
MKKDLFIDNNVAKNFTNPMDEEYKKLIKWLYKYENGSSENAYLVVSKKLISEYYRSSINAHTNTCIFVIIDKLTREGRKINISNEQIKEFQRKKFTKKVLKNLKSNIEDRDLIPIVLLSDRKYALTYDINLTYDLVNFPGYNARVEKRPENLPYNE